MNTENNKLKYKIESPLHDGDKRLIKVCSTQGELIIDEDGFVLSIPVSYNKNSYIHNISMFDMRRYYKANHGFTPTEVDILRLGYWNKSGSYDQPADGYERNTNPV